MVDEDASSKGRATPSRKEAEAARKKAMKTPLTRKEQAKRDRQTRTEIRERQQNALRSGQDERFLPPRDRGPVRRFVRDYVDRRYLVSEFLLPVLLVAFAATLLPQPYAGIGVIAWLATTVLTAVDSIVLLRRLKKQIRLRFPDESTRGVTMYVLLRATQIRRFRLPKPQIQRGAPLPARY